MLETVALWVALYLVVLGISSLLGVSGNQLVRARQKLDRLQLRNSFAIRKFNCGKVSQLSGVRRLNGLASRARRIVGHIDLYVFELRENKRIPVLRADAEKLFQSYRNLAVSFLKGEGKDLSVSALSDIGKSIEDLRGRVLKELNGELKF